MSSLLNSHRTSRALRKTRDRFQKTRAYRRLIDWMMDLPKPLEGLFLREILDFEKERQMPYVTSAEQMFREAGLEEGLRKGRQEGRQEGLHEGLLEGIELGLKLRFGAAGLVLMPEILAIADVDLLRTVRNAIETATTLEELRRVWA